MNIEGSKVLVLGGWGLVGMAVCRELLTRKPREIQIHSLREAEAEEAREELLPEAGETRLTTADGDLFGLLGEPSRHERLFLQLKAMTAEDREQFSLYRLLVDSKPEIVVDCVNTATVIAYRNVFRATSDVYYQILDDAVTTEAAENLLEALYVPRLIRHIQVMYQGMVEAGTGAYMKVGTSGTGGMGFNIPYTHSEEKPSRVLLSKSVMAGAHSMLLFLMARTPGAPLTKEIKPAAAIAWKRIAHGEIYRGGEPVKLVHARPRPLGETFSSLDRSAAEERDEILEAAYIDTGENGIFSLEEFAALTTARQMEFVTPEEIAQYLCFELEGRSTGYDVINALDNAVLGPSYRAGLLRHWALERMNELEREHGTHSVAFEMLGPPRLTKLLFEAHLLRLAFVTMEAVRDASAEEVSRKLDELVRGRPEIADEIAAVGIPLLLPSGEILRGIRVIVPGDADGEKVTAEKLETWVRNGWADLRQENCAHWIRRFHKIHQEIESIPEQETSSRHLRNRRFWDEKRRIQPGKVVGWILSEEEHGGRIKR